MTSAAESNPSHDSSIYDRLMPLMYLLIGAAAAMFLNALLCGNRVGLRKQHCATVRPARVNPASAPKDSSGSPKRHSPQAAQTAPVMMAAANPLPAGLPSAAQNMPQTLGQNMFRTMPQTMPENMPQTLGQAIPETTADSATTASTSTNAVEPLLAALVTPCVAARARSFRLAVRLSHESIVRRGFVGQDLGVTLAMIGCIKRQLKDVVLPMARPKGGYAEWRVRQTAGQLTWRQLRPRKSQHGGKDDHFMLHPVP